MDLQCPSVSIQFFHLTLTALLKIQNDISTSVYLGKAVAVTLFDPSTAFATIDHSILHTMGHFIPKTRIIKKLLLKWFYPTTFKGSGRWLVRRADSGKNLVRTLSQKPWDIGIKLLLLGGHCLRKKKKRSWKPIPLQKFTHPRCVGVQLKYVTLVWPLTLAL